jgi:gamma-glutamyltranspeptidase/glutathione hydrolase
MVATDAPLATRVGVEVLRSGGNAVDAAVATAFALAVVYPAAGNLGGGGFMVARMADGRTAALDFREMAPQAATRDMYLDAQGNLSDRSVDGWLASGVPGSVMGLWQAHRRFGTKPWAALLAPAIRMAEDGFVVDRNLHASLAYEQKRMSQYPGSAALFYPGGQPPAEGNTFRNPDLGRTLRRIAEKGPAGFYQGETAELVEREMKGHGGIITREDMKRYVARWREPVQFSYRGHTIISMPPSSSGGLTLALIANILQGYDLAALGWHSPAHVHLLAEAMRRAFADRNALLADADFTPVPREQFLSPAYAARLRASIDSVRATPSAAIRPGLGVAVGGMHTTHFGVVDGQGDAVGITTTINNGYGSGVTVTGAGFLMNDEMDDFAAKPGSPNMFGLVQLEANAIAAGKRPLSAMTPTIVLGDDGKPMLVAGASGGPRIITAVYQVLSNILDFGMDVGSAVAAPRVHQQHLPDVLFYETRGAAPDLLQALGAMGYQTPTSGGIGDAATILRRGGVWTGIADPRAGGVAEGY